MRSEKMMRRSNVASQTAVMEYWSDCLDHSGLMPAALMIGHHFSISDFCGAASDSGRATH
jgi:hypothetical protein